MGRTAYRLLVHDCGKITTPEFVVDKSTKLELIYDRIHEIRMRFEVLKREKEIAFLRRHRTIIANEAEQQQLSDELHQLDDDFYLSLIAMSVANLCLMRR